MSILKGLLANEDLLMGLGLLSGGSKGQDIGTAGLSSMLNAAKIKSAFGAKGFRQLTEKEIIDRKLNPNKAYQIDTKTKKVSAIGGGDTIVNNNTSNPAEVPLKIRNQYLKESADYINRKNSRDIILSNTKVNHKDRKAADDFTVVFQYYKFLDPNSAIKENEFETLKNLGSVGEKISQIIPGYTKGTTLSKEKIKDLENAMERSFPSYVKAQQSRENTYDRIFQEGGFDTSIYMQSFLPENSSNNNLKTNPRGMGKNSKESQMTTQELIEEYKRIKGLK